MSMCMRMWWVETRSVDLQIDGVYLKIAQFI